MQSRWIGITTVLLTLGGWTIVPILIKEFTTDVDGWTQNGWRYSIAALIWLPLLLWKKARKTWKRGLFRAAAVPGAINACAQVCFTMAFYQIDPGLVAFGLRAQIIAVTLGAAIMFPSERSVIKTRGFIIGMALLMVGTLTTIALSGEFGDKTGTLGIVLAMMAGVGFAGYALSVRKCMRGFGAMESFAAISQYTAVAMIILMFIFGKEMGATVLDMDLSRFWLFALSAVIGIAAGHVLYYISIERLGVTVSSGVIQLQPFTVAALSFFWFGEKLTIVQWAFGVVAVAGAITMIVVQHRVKSRALRATHLEPAEFADLPPDHVAAMAAGEYDRASDKESSSQLGSEAERAPSAP